ncbi:MAG: BACON domain-containing protein, partial [Bacteroidia bacterium]
PNNFIFMIRPLMGDLEIGQDTIVVSASAGTTAFEFTSTLNWTITTSASWLTTALSAGTSGYYAFLDGNTFTPQINYGTTRYGYIYVQNANDIDTLVVKQDPSPLQVTPDSLSFIDVGGAQNATIAYLSWATWNASSPDAWVTIAPSSGTGNANPTITCSLNPNNTPRSSYVSISGGVFRDTVWIAQDANLSTSIGTSQLVNAVVIYPNPGQGIFLFSGLTTTSETKLIVQNMLGASVYIGALAPDKTQVDLSFLEDGIYYLHLIDESGNVCVKQIVVTH